MNQYCSHETLEWLGLHLEVPRDWQIVRHGLSSRLGTLRFTDRYSERMTLSWHTLSREPDLVRMVAEQQHQDESAHPERIERLSISGWQGYRVVGNDRTFVRAVRFEEQTKQLWDVVLTLKTAYAGSSPVNEQLVSRIALTSSEQGRARLRAFDIDAEYPRELVMTKVDVMPASVTVEFERRRDGKPTMPRATAVVRRLGMASSWYRENPMGLLMRENPHLEFRDVEELSHNGHPALLAVGDTTKGRLSRWLGRTTTCRALVFHCEAENAVYHLATRSDERAPLLPLQLRLGCCQGKHAVEESA